LVVTLVATGLMLTLADPDGLPRAWPLVLLAMVAGLLLAPLAPQRVSAFTLGACAITGLLSAANPPRRFALTALAAALACALVAVTCLEGHAFGEVPILTQAGILFGINLGLAVPAGLSAIACRQWRHPVTPILLRIGSSWCVAVAVMLAAFELR
jgi:hypothetical protein